MGSENVKSVMNTQLYCTLCAAIKSAQNTRQFEGLCGRTQNVCKLPQWKDFCSANWSPDKGNAQAPERAGYAPSRIGNVMRQIKMFSCMPFFSDAKNRSAERHVAPPTLEPSDHAILVIRPRFSYKDEVHIFGY